MGQPNKEAIERFFDDLFGDSINERAQLVLWSSRDKRSHWASSVQEASAIAEGKRWRFRPLLWGCSTRPCSGA
jgi:hypothetical protein